MIQSLYIIGLLLCFRRFFNGTRCAALGMRIVSNKFGRVLTCFQILTYYLSGGTEEIHEVSLSLGSFQVENRTPDISDKKENISHSTAPSSSQLSLLSSVFLLQKLTNPQLVTEIPALCSLNRNAPSPCSLLDPTLSRMNLVLI